jgi:hypothetical protein
LKNLSCSEIDRRFRGFEVITMRLSGVAPSIADQSSPALAPHNFFEMFSIRIHYDPYTMAAFSRGLRSLPPPGEFICTRCMQFSTTSTAQSGHNRWSKIKHDKGSADAKKNVQRSIFAREITLASKRKVCLQLLPNFFADSKCSLWWRPKYKLATSSHTGNREERYIMGV